MRKLNPMKRPRTPPQSATRDPNEKASSSLRIWMDLGVSHAFICVTLPFCGTRLGSSITCNMKTEIIVKTFCSNSWFNPFKDYKMMWRLLTLYSMKEHGIKHWVSWSMVFLSIFQIASYALKKTWSVVKLSHKGNPSTLTLLHGGWHPALIMMLFSKHFA